MSIASAEQLMTADEYFQLPDDDRITELLRGRVVAMNPPGFRHGKRCSQVSYLIKRFLEDHDLGHVTTNDTGVITERDPDTVRGADVAFYSYERVAKDEEPARYPNAVPDLVIEVLSPEDRWREVLGKVNEYLDAGVTAVCVLDPDERKLHRYTSDHSPVELDENDSFEVPSVLPGFRIPVKKFFT
jgi:Uma2 family endonuclease